LEGVVKEINLVFDNCVGQNKNNMVLRMLILLVKKKICFRATAIFLVRGHTKNDADRAYNLLKLLYRKQNVFTPEDLWGALNDQEKCNCVMVSSDIFKDWKSMEDKYLSEIKDVTKNHIFIVDATASDTMSIQEYDGQPVEKQTIVKKTAPTNWSSGSQFLYLHARFLCLHALSKNTGIIYLAHQQVINFLH
jgi:hypothetical protein